MTTETISTCVQNTPFLLVAKIFTCENMHRVALCLALQHGLI